MYRQWSTSFSHSGDHVSPNGLKTVIQSSKSKSCALGPIPTWLLKDCIDVLLPTLTDVMNASLDQGISPSFFKKSLIQHLTLMSLPTTGPSPIYRFSLRH